MKDRISYHDLFHIIVDQKRRPIYSKYTFFIYKQPFYKQPGLRSQKAKQLLRLTLPT